MVKQHDLKILSPLPKSVSAYALSCVVRLKNEYKYKNAIEKHWFDTRDSRAHSFICAR